ncbi:hypothetical protein AMAG_18508 [Allomyces macrogynus ATCC 38327]|uniref:Uncharacterized protein n=1 Tax=Allomyces macrogynus (strain ATCC 38327) TaxID=578462 RepID=A0A0L0SCL9_ALLM3|nr:hypothetical protein AMAG_18508 [Allomyces macrogynus ATCC 38327]|eukprot:KNE60293.1 hypothetical protein AMAG_18508 [Allomyces macrogynus ATCC 38327]
MMNVPEHPADAVSLRLRLDQLPSVILECLTQWIDRFGLHGDFRTLKSLDLRQNASFDWVFHVLPALLRSLDMTLPPLTSVVEALLACGTRTNANFCTRTLERDLEQHHPAKVDTK